jgi:hypothetical protein
VDAESLKIVIGAAKRGNFAFASIARSGIYLADIQGTTQELANLFGFTSRCIGIFSEFFAGVQIPAADKRSACNAALRKPGRNAQCAATCVNAIPATGTVAVVQDEVTAVVVSLETQSRSWTGVNGADCGIEVQAARVDCGHAAACAVAQQFLDWYEHLLAREAARGNVEDHRSHPE